MPDISTLRTQLAEARRAREGAETKLFEARERISKAEAERATLMRLYKSTDRGYRERLLKIAGDRSDARKAARAIEDGRLRAEAREKELVAAFEALSDPTKDGVPLDDSIPLLLFPVRLETRFKTIATPAAVRRELWVRVYPDDCLIDSFEETLSDNEVDGAERYWIARWKAGKVPEQHRGAWRALVASFGAGRSRWIYDHYQPTNLSEEPKKAKKDDVVLVLPTHAPLGDPEASAVLEYWIASWVADDDVAQEVDARNAFDLAVGAGNADALLASYRPVNLREVPAAPKKKADVQVKAAFVGFPPRGSLPTKQQSWSRPAVVRLLPDRFVFTGYRKGVPPVEVVGRPIPSPLIAGPDPQAVGDDQLQQENGDLHVPDAMKWFVDFERAVADGMGFKVDLSAAGAESGFDRVVVLGLRLSADEEISRTDLQTLLEHHRDGPRGFSLVAQGTPTNNTEAEGSGFTQTEDADESFDATFNPPAPLTFTDERRSRRDGEWLASALGIDLALLDTVARSRGTDQSEAQAMNVALWPATLGYMLDTMMQPLFGDDAVDAVRSFFNKYVTGRGLLPAIRIGRQPYGILPTSALSRLQWPGADGRIAPSVGGAGVAALQRIYGVLRAMESDWSALAAMSAHLGKPGDPQQVLLDVLGLHPTSAEYYERYAESVNDLYNRWNIWGMGADFLNILLTLEYTMGGMSLLERLGLSPGSSVPDVLQHLFLDSSNPLKGPFIDDRPLSETSPIREYTDDHKNYIEWLRAAAETSLGTLREETGFSNDTPPSALLYLLLRHGLLEAYWDASLRLHQASDVMNPPAVQAARRESPFIHVAAGDVQSESRWSYLYKAESRITHDNAQLVGEYIPTILGLDPAAAHLAEMLAALQLLERLPTARLERLFAEHLDCCSYRLDAWQQGLMHLALDGMRFRREQDQLVVKTGIHLGAFGWLEEVRPKNEQLVAVQLDTAPAAIFQPADAAPLMHASTNGGYIYAPSLNQAVTAAVLRNGYLSNASPANQQTLAVNLSSRRVRAALSLLVGRREGQSLSALLGYQFERGLHDAHALAEVDKFIYSLRKQFPLRADLIPETKSADDVPIEAIEARNVMDGVSLVDHVRTTGNAHYPFGLTLEPATADEADVIDAEVQRLFDSCDAVADVAVAESVHQAVQSNYDRVAATLDTTGKGQLPPEIRVVQTPRTGQGLTHRVALHLESGLDEDQAPPGITIPVTPRARAEPAINSWLARVLPDPTEIGCVVSYFDPTTSALTDAVVTQQDLGLQPIDLFYVASVETQQAMAELDDRVLLYVQDTFKSRPDSQIFIRYTQRPGSGTSFFEVAPLIRSLRSLLLHARPLRPSDAALPTEAKQSTEPAMSLKKPRVTKVQTALETLRNDVVTFATALAALHADELANAAQIIADIDTDLTAFVKLLERASRFGILQSGWGFALDWRKNAFAALLSLVREVVDRWTLKLADFDARITRYDAIATTLADDEKFALLATAERFVRAKASSPPPASANDYRADLDTARASLANRLMMFRTALNPATNSIFVLAAQVATLVAGPPPVTEFDLQTIDATVIGRQIIAFSGELADRATALAARIRDTQLTPVAQLLADHDATVNESERTRLLSDAAKVLLGDAFLTVPEFTMSQAQADEFTKAIAASTAGDLLKYQQTQLKVAFPVDTWLAGVARVREKMRDWERTGVLSSALGATEPPLIPLQLPFKQNDSWIAVEYPADYVLDGERLLYTASLTTPFNGAAPQCGLLLDEWTEVIPSADETTGLTFHYDRPNAEAPQTLLLLTPPEFTGSWKWRDVVDSVSETFQRAKNRAVEPSQLDATNYARFLPATVLTTTLYQISIMTNIARNNEFHATLGANANG